MRKKAHQPTVIQKRATPIWPRRGSTFSSTLRPAGPEGAGVPGQTGCPAYGFGGTGSSRVGSKTGIAWVGAVTMLGTCTVNCSSGAGDPLDPPEEPRCWCCPDEDFPGGCRMRTMSFVEEVSGGRLGRRERGSGTDLSPM